MTSPDNMQELTGDRMSERSVPEQTHSETSVSEHQCLQLSSLMDGDVPSAPELERLLANQQARATWGRYHLIRDAVQSELPEHYCDLSTSISLALADEPTVLAPRPRPVNAWQKVVGFAVAASVFAVAIVSFQSFQTNDAAVATSAESTPTMMVAAPVSQVADAPVVIDDERARLEDMLINHTEAVSANGLNVMLPYARVVSDRIDISVEEPPVEVLPAESAPKTSTEKVEQVQP